MRNWYDISRRKEWLLARYEGAKQERSIWYHGTKASNLPTILSKGLIVDPKNRAWDVHDDASFTSPSQASISDIYVTRNMLTARIAAQHNLPTGEDRVLVIMELQPRSLAADEDSLTHYVKSVLNSLGTGGSYEHLIAEVFMANALGTNPEYVSGTKDKYVKTGVNLINKQYGPLHPKLLERIAEILEGGWEIVLGRQAAYIDDYQWRRTFYRNISPAMNKLMEDEYKQINAMNTSQDNKDQLYSDFVNTLIPKKPEAGAHEDQYLKYMDQLTRTVKNAARPVKAPSKADMMTARSVENIGFSGSNRIIAIVKIDKNMNVEIVYGTLPDDFKAQWKESTGELNIVNKPKTASSDKLYKTAARAIWYHGTLIENYKQIASEGLLVNPQKRLWDKTDKGDMVAPSKASFPGIYLTNELIDAINAPDNALDAMGYTKKTDNNILLVVVQADTQSLYVDEDAMSFEISSATEGVSDYLISLIYLSGVSKIDTPYFERMKDKFVERQMKILNKKFNLTHAALISRIRDVLRDGFINSITRQAAYVSDDDWKKAYLDIQNQQQRLQKQDKSFANLKIPQKPSPALGEEMFRQLMDQLTKTLKFSRHQQERENVHGEYWTSGRYPENITYNGSTKILALVDVLIRDEEGEFIDTTDYTYRVLYGTLPSQFFEDWKKIKAPVGEIPQQKTGEQEAYENWYENVSKF